MNFGCLLAAEREHHGTVLFKPYQGSIDTSVISWAFKLETKFWMDFLNLFFCVWLRVSQSFLQMGRS